jgi:HAD superfamily hydrolase (TIGR01509 family)
MMGTPAKQAFQHFCKFYSLEEPMTDLIEESGRHFYEVLGGRLMPLMDGIGDMLDRIGRRNIPTAIATSSSRRYVNRILGPHQLLGRFQFVLTCEDVEFGKPHPEMYLKAAERLGHAPNEMVVLEDSMNGIRSAKAAGAQCVAIPHERSPKNGMTEADAVVTGLCDERLQVLLGL